MTRVEVANYLNSTMWRNGYDQTDVNMIRNFISIKHNKLVSQDEIIKAMNMRGFNLQNLMWNFFRSLSEYYNITEVYKNGKIIKYYAT